MKINRVSYFLVLLIALNGKAFSQAAFYEGTNIINFGIGFGNLYYGGLYHGTGYDYSITPAFAVSFDHGVSNVEEIQGTIGIGGLIGYQSSNYKYSDPSGYFYHNHWSNFVIAPRATYHATFLNTDQWDLYGGLMLGIRIEHYSFETNSSSNANSYSDTYGGVHLWPGLIIGGTYYFTDAIGIFGELGYDISYLKIGLSVRPGFK